MTPTVEWLKQAEAHIRKVLLELRPKLLEAQGHVEHELKEDNTIVTKMDRMVEEHLQKTLKELAPEVGFAGEETGADYEQQTFWLVDPIDGTEPFTRGLPFATNLIALIHDGKVRLGIIYNFALDEFYSAIEGRGAFCNGHPIHVSNRRLDRAIITIGLMRKHPRSGELTDQLVRQVWSTVKCAAGGYELALVARGSTEARLCIYGTAKPWDLAAGTLLITEAGGRVANIGSDHYDFRDTRVLAANQESFDGLMGTLAEFDRKHGAEQQ